MKKGETKSKKLCVMKHCQNIRYQDKLLCYNHLQIKDKLYSYRYKYGDLKEAIITTNPSGKKFERC